MMAFPLPVMVFVGLETLRSLLAYAAVNGKSLPAVWVISLSEFAKLSTVFVALFFQQKNVVGETFVERVRSAVGSLKQGRTQDYFQYAIPAVLYFVNNNLWFWGLKFTPPALLFLAVLAKLPFTGILHHLCVRRQRSRAAWISLALLCLGLLISQAPDRLIDYIWQRTPTTKTESRGWEAFAGILVGLVISLFSAIASIFTELRLKDESTLFWTSQFWLYFWGAVCSSIGIMWTGAPDSEWRSDVPSIILNLLVVLTTILMGLTVAIILREGDSLLKLVGSSSALVTITIMQAVFFADLREKTLAFHPVLGCGTVAVGCWAYGYYRTAKLNGESASYSRLPEATARPSTKNADAWYVPNLRKVLGAMAVVLCLAIFSQIAHPAVREWDGISSKYGNVSASNLSQLEEIPYEERTAHDIARYFEPIGIEPAVWGSTPSPNGCLYNWIHEHNFTETSSKMIPFINAYEKAIIASGCPIFPSMALLSHMYWAGPWRKFQLVSIDAWLATQALSDGHRLVYWYTVDPGKDIRQRYDVWTRAGVVEFREFNMTEESKGTCLTEMREWTDDEYRKSVGMKMVTLSDLVRVLILAKYGGIWLDTDDILLRDLTPLIRSGPIVPRMSLDDGYHNHNNNFLIYGPASAGIGRKVLGTACQIRYDESLWSFGGSSKPMDWVWLYNDGLHRVCRLETKCGVSDFPVEFFDGMHFRYGPAGVWPCDRDYDEGSTPDLAGLFVWHARLNQENSECYNVGKGNSSRTAAAIVVRLINEALERRAPKGMNNDGLNLL